MATATATECVVKLTTPLGWEPFTHDELKADPEDVVEIELTTPAGIIHTHRVLRVVWFNLSILGRRKEWIRYPSVLNIYRPDGLFIQTVFFVVADDGHLDIVKTPIGKPNQHFFLEALFAGIDCSQRVLINI